MANIVTSYNPVSWQSKTTPLSAKNFNTMDAGIANLYDLLFPEISTTEDRVLVLQKNTQAPDWLNIVNFMNQSTGYHYNGDLE